jgi:hypothetical protein
MKELVYSVKVGTRDALLGLFWIPQTESATVSVSCNEQFAQLTTERQPVLRPVVAFSKTSFKHR